MMTVKIKETGEIIEVTTYKSADGTYRLQKPGSILTFSLDEIEILNNNILEPSTENQEKLFKILENINWEEKRIDAYISALPTVIELVEDSCICGSFEETTYSKEEFAANMTIKYVDALFKKLQNKQ